MHQESDIFIPSNGSLTSLLVICVCLGAVASPVGGVQTFSLAAGPDVHCGHITCERAFSPHLQSCPSHIRTCGCSAPHAGESGITAQTHAHSWQRTQVDFSPVPAVDWTSPTTIVAAFALLIALMALLFAVSARRSLARVQRSTDILNGDGANASLAELVAHRTQDIQTLGSELAALAARLDATRMEVATALRHVAVVRYDAFGDMGGRMSFSSALLDDNGDGLLITSIHGRSETRTYMKPVRAGKSDQISPEEQQAIAQAMGR